MKRAWMRAGRGDAPRLRSRLADTRLLFDTAGCTRCSRCAYGNRAGITRPAPPPPAPAGRVIRYEGELDLVTAASFGEGLRAAAEGVSVPRLVVDLTEVWFMDGSPLRELCLAEERVASRGGWIRVVYRQRSIGMLFRASGLAQRFPRYASVEDARAGRTAPGNG